MNNSLRQFILLGLTILLFQNCHSLAYTFEDEWTVSDFEFANMSAMDEEMALEWMGKKAIINKQLYFEYKNIKSYKNIFEGDSFCTYRKGWTKEKVFTDSFLSDYGITASELGIDQNEILIIHTSCSGTPFQDILIKSDDEIIVSWDGVFFILTREKDEIPK
ncbi:MAG: hypothetical protein CMP53_01555 [Flavobacteriales bacterium]|nr:hypothetical protein [Flavobacteriales bacterium]|tara:strand:- start:1066 stop:1551 length:486 start_codon:yes stop_codon:yes gene_type:complete